MINTTPAPLPFEGTEGMSVAPTILTVELPYPPKPLHPNGGDRHKHGYIAKLKKDSRYKAHLIALSAKGRGQGFPWPAGVITAHWHHPQERYRPHDDDNLTAWLKPYRDGCADAGIVKDDKHLKMGEHHQDKDASNPRVVLVFTKGGEDG